MELRATIAFQAAEHVAGQAFAVQADERRCAGRLADEQRDVLACGVGGAEGDDLCVFGPGDGEAGAGGDFEAARILVRGDVGGGDRVAGVMADPREPGGKQPGDPRQLQRGACGVLLGERHAAKRSLERRRQVELRIGQRSRGVEIEPGAALDRDRRDRIGGVALVGQFERCRAPCGQQHERFACGI